MHRFREEERDREKRHAQVKEVEEQDKQLDALMKHKDYTEAQILSRQILQTKQSLYGHRDEKTLDTQYDQARVLSKLKRYREAEKLCRQTWKARKQVLGPTDKITLRSQHYLAMLLVELDRYEEAEKLYRQTWEARKQVLGPTYKNTLNTQHHLASVLVDLDRYEEAEKLYRQTWETQKQVLYPTHERTLATQHDLAYILQELERYEEAEELYRQTWKARKQVLGSMHISTLHTQHGLACVFRKLDRYEEAEKLYGQTWKAQQQVLGPAHESTLNTQYSLAYVLDELKRYEEAEELYRQTWAIRQQVLGEADIDTLWSMLGLSLALFKLQRYAASQELVQSLLLKFDACSSDKRGSLTLKAKILLSQCFIENGSHSNSQEILREVVEAGPSPGEPELGDVAKFCLEVASTDSQSSRADLPAITSAMEQHTLFPSGKRFLEKLELLRNVQKHGNPADLVSAFAHESASFITCQESKTFLERVLDQNEAGSASIETDVMTIRADDRIPTTLELDIYYARPKHTDFMAREAHLDTQATVDFISDDLIEHLGHSICPYEGVPVSTAGGLITPIGQVSLFFEWQKSSKLRKRRFLVMSNLPFDIILGISFITEYEVYTAGNGLLVMALSPLKPDERKQMQIRAIENRKRRDAEERADEERNRLKRLERILARQSKSNVSNPVELSSTAEGNQVQELSGTSYLAGQAN